MTEQSKRVRNRKASLQLQAALNDAEILSNAEPTLETVEQMRLVKTRLTVLSRKAACELVEDRKQLRDALAAAKTENERLTRQHDLDVAELARLRVICRTGTGATFDDIAMRTK